MLVNRRGSEGTAYEASAVLGQGSFSTVYLGEIVGQPGRQVALKSLSCRRGQTTADIAARQEMVAEAELLQTLQHPGILRCHEWFEEGCAAPGKWRIWIVLDYMDGGDLHELYKERRRTMASPMDAAFFCRVITSMSSALDYIHGISLLHRDVKCMNVLLSRSRDQIVLGDFGLSCSANAAAKRAASGDLAAVGTPSYLPPEVICGQPHSAASDAWSLGVVAFKLSALQRPFEARDTLALTMKIVKTEPRKLPLGCAADVECTVMGLLNKDKQKRLLPADARASVQDYPIARLSCMASIRLPPRLSCL